MDTQKITKQYYANVLGISAEQTERKGLHFYFSPERDKKQKGYPEVFDAKSICPQWSTNYDNVASENLAYSLGFQKLSETVTVSI